MINTGFFLMQNALKNYPWGSRRSLTQLFDIANRDNQPQAELWMGAHPDGCSHICVNNEMIPLNQWIAQHPKAALGENTRYEQLPFLFKVLAAQTALSVQVHPNKEQAEIGFKRENALGIARDASQRNYKDNNHKPELIYALTDFQAMNGFRPVAEIISDFKRLALQNLLLADFQQKDQHNTLKALFLHIMTLNSTDKDSALETLINYARQNSDQTRFAVIVALSEQYPNDIGLFSPLFLNIITLRPGEAMFLPAGTLHAYLHGTALEVMASSDNVLRAGLTSKHIDVDELVDKTLFIPTDEQKLLAAATPDLSGVTYQVPVADFRLSIYEAIKAVTIHMHSAEIIFAIDHGAQLTHQNGQTLQLHRGQSAFIPAASQQYNLSCSGRVARVFYIAQPPT